jgi:hypothetical protein
MDIESWVEMVKTKNINGYSVENLNWKKCFTSCELEVRNETSSNPKGTC